MKVSKFIFPIEDGATSYAFSTLTGSLVQLSDEHYNWLNNNKSKKSSDIIDIPEGLYDALYSAGMIIPKHVDEVSLLNAEHEYHRYTDQYVDFTIAPTMDCNFNCTYCFQDKSTSYMGVETIAKLVDFIKIKAGNCKHINIVWFGGEPLLAMEQIAAISEQLIDFAESKGITYSAVVVSNGYLLTTSCSKLLKKYKVETIAVTIDGTQTVHNERRKSIDGGDSFSTIIKNLHAVSDIDISLGIKVDTSNSSDIKPLLKFLADEDLQRKIRLCFGPVHKSFADDQKGSQCKSCYNPAEFSLLLSEYWEYAIELGFKMHKPVQPQKIACCALRKNSYVIDAGGKLYKCWETVGKPEHVVGNLDQEIINNQISNKWLSVSPFDEYKCLNCKFLPSCLGGCYLKDFKGLDYDQRCCFEKHEDYLEESIRLFLQSLKAEKSIKQHPQFELSPRVKSNLEET